MHVIEDFFMINALRNYKIKMRNYKFRIAREIKILQSAIINNKTAQQNIVLLSCLIKKNRY